MFNLSKYFIASFKSIKVFLIRINPNKYATKFLFYCFLSFYILVSISVAVSIFINFYYKLVVMKIKINPITKTLYYVCIFSPLNELIIFVSADCLSAKMTSYCLNPNLALNLWAGAALQSIITLSAKVSTIKIVLTCFFGSSNSSYLCFLWFEFYFVETSRKFLWFNPSSICFSFNHNIPSLSTILSTVSFTRFSAYISHFSIVYSIEV